MPFQAYSYMFFSLSGDLVSGTLTPSSNIIQPQDPEFTELGGAVADTFEVGETYSDTLLIGDWVYQGYYDGAPVGRIFLFQSTSNSSNYIFVSLDDTQTSGTDPSPGDWPDSVSATMLVKSNLAHCFWAGTEIATGSGCVVVEALGIGDEVLTADGQIRRIKWIGRQTVMTRFGPAERLMPVRFAARSLGKDVPHSDLTVTADHGMLVEGVICHAGALVNGTTIRRVPLAEMGETYTVFHIETEEHEIILANGAPAETFIDNVSRRAFDNYAEFEALYGDVPEMEELPYPRAMSARQVPGRIVAKLAGKAVA
ncbi:Hint domain-containing protein [Nioella ostreopsis]|uniref:Hint domain-containing protein n=1 Tax=Nioella ostreopsis TaxID=2448479 RepID=UPI000FDB070A|nr:Hint domain-containing protein [Nioella ostreopsis]